MTDKILVPFSREMQACAINIESFLEDIGYACSEFFIASIAIEAFLHLLLLNAVDQTVVGAKTNIFKFISFEEIYKKLYQKPVDHWELVGVPEEFVYLCEEIMHRAKLDSIEDSILMSIGYFAELIQLLEDKMAIFTAEQVGDDIALGAFSNAILDSYHPSLM